MQRDRLAVFRAFLRLTAASRAACRAGASGHCSDKGFRRIRQRGRVFLVSFIGTANRETDFTAPKRCTTASRPDCHGQPEILPESEMARTARRRVPESKTPPQRAALGVTKCRLLLDAHPLGILAVAGLLADDLDAGNHRRGADSFKLAGVTVVAFWCLRCRRGGRRSGSSRRGSGSRCRGRSGRLGGASRQGKNDSSSDKQGTHENLLEG